MKKILIIPLLLFNFILNAQSLNYQWAKRAGGSGLEHNTGIVIDPAGNIYTTGFFSSNAISFDGYTLTNGLGDDDSYIAKYDPNGNILWLEGMSGLGDLETYRVAIDAASNIYIVGNFYQSPNFGGIILNNVSSMRDLFIVKYDSGGNSIWGKSFGTSQDDRAYGVCVDVDNNVYFTGSFHGSSITIGTTNHISNGLGDIIIAKLDSSGNILWSKNEGGNSWDEGDVVFTDLNGNIYVSGSFRSNSVSFGATTLVNSSLNNGKDIFLVKYDSNGNVQWAKSGMAPGWEYIAQGCVDFNDNVYLTGNFDSPSITFDSIILYNSNAGSKEIFFVKYDAIGNLIWAKSLGGISDDVSYDLISDNNGDIYLTGYFKGVAQFDTLTVIDNGNGDLFISKYDTNGNLIFFIQTGENGYERGSSIAIDNNNDFYISGTYSSSPINFGFTSLLNSGSQDIFVAKLSTATDVEELNDQKEKIQIFPNPFSFEAIIKSETIINDATILIKNSLGQVVMELNKINGREFTITAENLSNGLYFFELINNNKILTGKLIVNKN